MQGYTVPLREGAKNLNEATLWLMQNAMKKPDNAGAASTDYMHLMGLVTLGYMWAIMVDKAQLALKAGTGDKQFYENKLVTGRYFMERIMPETAAHLARIRSGCDTMMELDAAQF